MICAYCSELFSIKYALNALEYVHRRNARQMKASAGRCWMCKELYEWLPGTDEHDEETRGLWHRIFHPEDGKYKDVIEYGARVAEFPDHPGYYRLQLRFWLTSDRALPPDTPPWKRFLFMPYEQASRYLSISDLASSTGSEQALRQACRWLSVCQQKHGLCQAYLRSLPESTASKTNFRPRRLIHILPNHIQLHETRESQYKYVALTHRWPSEPTSLLRLTVCNYEQLLRSIPQDVEHGFSKVFADAIVVCRRLGISYIWIDSLCIIQEGDDMRDWHVESTKMGDVYKHAYCTFSATSSGDSDGSIHEGMFRNRTPRNLQPTVAHCKFDYTAPIHPGQPIPQNPIKFPKAGHYLFRAQDSWHSGLTSSPIFKRGWVAQERHLSPRILYFAQDQVWFDCYELMAREIWPLGDPIVAIGRPLRGQCIIQDLVLHRAKLLDETSISTQQRSILNNTTMSWMNMTCGFAGLRFTKGQDKLLSVGGLAKSIMPFINASPQDYKAGIWIQSLPYSLLWYTHFTGRPTHENGRPFLIRPRDPHQAPSWSWASINWPCELSFRWEKIETEPLVSIQSFNIIPNNDPLTDLPHPTSSLTLLGKLFSCKLFWYYSAQTNVKPTTKYTPEIITKYGNLNSWSGDGVHPDERYLEGVTKDKRNDLMLLPMLRTTNRNEGYQLMETLILEPTETKGVWRRFGIVGIKGSTREKMNFHDCADGGKERVVIV